MKKCMMVMLCLLFTCALIGAQADDAALQMAISMGKSIELREIELLSPEDAFAGDPVAVSPDGQTVLWRTSLGGCLTRNGRVIPIRPAPRRGAGDPYHYLESEMERFLKSMPGTEGISWSPDGRYIVFSDKSKTVAGKDIIRPLDLILLDTRNGEVFQALPFDNDKRGIANKTYGTVVEARFDLTGEYVYFIGRIDAYSEQYCLYRYNINTGETEMVMENVCAGSVGRCLFPDADGSWLLMTWKDSNTNDPDNCNTYIRLWPDNATSVTSTSSSAGKTERVERGFPLDVIQGYQNCYSEKTRSGLILIGDRGGQRLQKMAGDSLVFSIPAMYNQNRLNRIIGGVVDPNEYWELVHAPEDWETMWLEKLDPQLINIMERFCTGQELTENEYGTLQTLGWSRMIDYVPMISCVCQSPGGRYGMICTYSNSEITSSKYWLLDIETMALTPVKTPDNMQGVAFASRLHEGFSPCMVWNDDDTLLILQNGNVGTYQLEIR